MTQKNDCPLCGSNPLTKVSFSVIRKTPSLEQAFMRAICDRCWDAIWDVAIPDEYKPVNEAEQLDGAK